MRKGDESEGGKWKRSNAKPKGDNGDEKSGKNASGVVADPNASAKAAPTGNGLEDGVGEEAPIVAAAEKLQGKKSR